MEEMRTHITIRLSFSLPRVSFSPQSVVRVKPGIAIEEMRRHETIRLLFSLPRVSFPPESGGRVNPGEVWRR
jgi:hypothetical protein